MAENDNLVPFFIHPLATWLARSRAQATALPALPLPSASANPAEADYRTQMLESEGWQVQSVETENRGFDLIARKPHPEDPQTAIDVRFVEVKGRAGVGEVILSDNEYRTAVRLNKDYWLYAVFSCASKPQAHVVQDPARLGWEPLVKIEHYHVGPEEKFRPEGGNDGDPVFFPGREHHSHRESP